MGRLLSVGLWLIVLMTGCVPSREAKSAGQVGCTPDEITISNEESHFGLVQSGDTWVAECRGRTFVCSQINQAGKDEGLFASLLASEQVSCREAPDSREAESTRRMREVAMAERANRRPSPAPTGAAGFHFGETPEDLARRCEAAGQAWRNGSSGVTNNGNVTNTGSIATVDNRASVGNTKSGCSGPAAALGIAASVDIGFCDGRACSITLEHVPRANWSRSSVSLKASLEAKYGPVQESSGSVPEECRSEQALKRCLESRHLALRYIWRWATGESIEMTVGKPTERESAAIRVLYRRPVGAANVSAL
ncbi:MAG: hypothetical protein ACOY0T_38855 [Myxococcota bacterium]